MKLNPSLIEERLLAKAKRQESGCLIFVGTKDTRGYGRLRIGKKYQRAHRLMYELHHGAIPPGYVVRHRCDNPSCIAIEHLEIGTQFDNVQDAWSRGRAHGNVGESNGRAKLTEDQVREIRGHYKPHSYTFGAAAFARRFGVHDDVVRSAIHGKTWTHI